MAFPTDLLFLVYHNAAAGQVILGLVERVCLSIRSFPDLDAELICASTAAYLPVQAGSNTAPKLVQIH